MTGDTGSTVPLPTGHGDEPVPEPIWYPGGPIDASLLTGYADHAARRIWNGEDRDPQRFYNHGRKIAGLVQPDESWFQDVLSASGLRDLCQVGYTTIHNGMLMAFAERWHPEVSSFHLPRGEITITLDDVTCLLHLPIRGILLSHGRLTKEKAMEILIVELGYDLDDALDKVERSREAHVRFRTLERLYDIELLAAHQAAGVEVEADIHRERALRCYLLYLIGTHLFVDTSSTYTDVVYLRYLPDKTRIHEYNWGAVVLAYSYYKLGEGCLWKARTVADIIGWGEVPTYTKLMLRASTFSPLRGNHVSDA
ncbi:protein MAIN-LIKE 1-like [Vicia villosa]|uniref:protein MAIN-LIKE 1-like n=1 Tax=Vicia villosa TaxID=3911 RepID=UPI00273B093F|nr:protein MAIN-LIKE 1-like [Vicia villosa]